MGEEGGAFVPLSASSLVPGRKILIAPQRPLAIALRKAKLLQKAKDKGALTTLIDLFAGQAAVVVEAPSIFHAHAEKTDGMCKIRTSVGTTASLPIGAIGADPDAERQLVSCRPPTPPNAFLHPFMSKSTLTCALHVLFSTSDSSE